MRSNLVGMCSVVAAVAVAGPASAKASIIASDKASNYSGPSWSNQSTGGSGFMPWRMWRSGSDVAGWRFESAGSYLGANAASMDTGGRSFQIHGVGEVRAERELAQPMAVGETFSFDLAHESIQGFRGFQLWRNGTYGGEQAFDFQIDSNGYSWTGGGSAPAIAWSGLREFGVKIHVEFTRTETGYQYSLTSAQGLSASGSIVGRFDFVRMYHRWDSNNSNWNLGGTYFNNLEVSVIPAPGAIALLGMAGLVGRGRRRN
jgi:hypothetical protein